MSLSGPKETRQLFSDTIGDPDLKKMILALVQLILNGPSNQNAAGSHCLYQTERALWPHTKWTVEAHLQAEVRFSHCII